jgi:hypothetical protein
MVIVKSGSGFLNVAGILVIIAILFGPALPFGHCEALVPLIPQPSYVTLHYRQIGGSLYVDAEVMFTDSSCQTESWGTPIIAGHSISVSAIFWHSLGIVLPIVFNESHTYSLGNLGSDEYVFIFNAWGSQIKNMTVQQHSYVLTISSTAGGSTSPAQGNHSYEANSVVQVFANAKPTFQFDHWELDSVNAGTANPYSVEMDDDHALKAVFESLLPPVTSVGGSSASPELRTEGKTSVLYAFEFTIMAGVLVFLRKATSKASTSTRRKNFPCRKS